MGRQAYPGTALESTELGFLVFDSFTFARYSLWNYGVYLDSYRFGILFDRKLLFYIKTSILFIGNQ